MFTPIELTEIEGGLHKFAMRLTRNHADAQDLVQSTFLRALEKRHLFKKGTRLFSWTSKIMYNLFVSGYRRKTKFESQYDPELQLERLHVEASQENSCELKNVAYAMQELSSEHRTVLQLVCVKGLRYEEAASTLGIPVGTVRSRLSRARKALQSQLEEGTCTTVKSLQRRRAFFSGYNNDNAHEPGHIRVA